MITTTPGDTLWLQTADALEEWAATIPRKRFTAEVLSAHLATSRMIGDRLPDSDMREAIYALGFIDFFRVLPVYCRALALQIRQEHDHTRLE